MGSQKFGAYWTGDNRSIWSELQGSMTMVLQLGLSGHPFGGADVPGFYGNPSEDNAIGFWQLGAYFPFFRAHSHIDYTYREPWEQPPRVFGALRNAIEDRYDLIHYIYSAFYQHTQTGEPIMRTMWNEYADDENVYDIYTQFMFGSDMLVAPKVTQPDDVLAAFGLMEVTYYLPTSDSWYIWNTGTKLSINGWQTVQLETEKEAKFARAGSIFPILEHQNCHSLLECIDNPIQLKIFPDENGDATGYFYTDDGKSLNYTSEENSKIFLELKASKTQITSTGDNSYEWPDKQVLGSVVIYGVTENPVLVLAGGTETKYTWEEGDSTLFILGRDEPLYLDESPLIEISY